MVLLTPEVDVLFVYSQSRKPKQISGARVFYNSGVLK